MVVISSGVGSGCYCVVVVADSVLLISGVVVRFLISGCVVVLVVLLILPTAYPVVIGSGAISILING